MKKKLPQLLTRTVWIVSLVSLFTDISSEMLYPVMPVYLKTIGFTALGIGLLEGVAEAVVGLSKGFFGKLSDDTGRRLPFVQAGYFLSAISKPMMAMFTNVGWIFTARSADRLGKGVRTAARDTILSAESSQENRGKVFGFHRAMDTLGAAIGPIMALVYLHFYPLHYKSMFLIAFFPALAGVLLTLFIREKKVHVPKAPVGKSYNPFSYLFYWKNASVQYKKLLIGLLFFALFNSSDVLLLLMARNQGFNDQQVIIAYIIYNLIYALFAFPMGMLADKLGMKIAFAIGLLFFAITYAGIVFVSNDWTLYLIFSCYGLYAASTEGISKAWISKLCPLKETATGIGLYGSLSSIVTMLSSSLAGLLWVSYRPGLPFLISAIGTVLVVVYISMLKNNDTLVSVKD